MSNYDGATATADSKAWVSSAELYPLYYTSQSPRRARGSFSFSSSSPFLTRSLSASETPAAQTELELKRAAICYISDVGTGHKKGQGIVISLGPDLRKVLNTELPLALLTCHSVIANPTQIRDLKIHIGDTCIKLSDKKFTKCFSCCGQHPIGIWKEKIHPDNSCPLGANFTLLCMDHSLANQILKLPLWFPVISKSSLEIRRLEDALQSEQFFIIEKADGMLSQAEIQLQHIAPETYGQSLEKKITAYRENCKVRYIQHGSMVPCSPGASMFYHDVVAKEPRFLGIHSSVVSGDGGQNGESTHCGTTVHAVAHAVSGGGDFCGLIPSLSLLRMSSICHCWREKWYKGLQECLEGRAAGSQQPLSLRELLGVLEFLIRSEPQVLRLSVEDLRCNTDSLLASLKLLSCVFCLKTAHESLDVKMLRKEIDQTFHPEGILSAFNQSLQEACKMIYILLERAAEEDSALVAEACLKCLLSMGHFEVFLSEILYDETSLEILRRVRNNCKFENSLPIQRMSGDIYFNYSQHIQREKSSEQEKECRCQLELQAQRYEANRTDLTKHFTEQLAQRDELIKKLQQEKHSAAEAAWYECEREMERERQEIQGKLEQYQAMQVENITLLQKDRERQQVIRDLQKHIEEMKQERTKLILEVDHLNKDTELIKENERLQQEIAMFHQQLSQANDRAIAAELALKEHQCRAKEVKVHSQVSRLKSEGKDNAFPLVKSSSLPSLEHYPTRVDSTSILKEAKFSSFWEQEMVSLLCHDVGLREKIGEQFQKVTGSSGSSNWEHLLAYLREHESVLMDAEALEKSPPGDIVYLVMVEWGKKRSITVEEFCRVSSELGITRVRDILNLAGQET